MCVSHVFLLLLIVLRFSQFSSTLLFSSFTALQTTVVLLVWHLEWQPACMKLSTLGLFFSGPGLIYG